MKLMLQLSLLLIPFLLTSCNYCKLWGVTSMGNNFSIVESDKDHVAINYCTSQCCDSGIPIVPSNITEYNFNSKWIIAKSINSSTNSYWIIEKEFKIESDSHLREKIFNHVLGPLDSIDFRKKIDENKIELILTKYQSLQ